MIISPVFGHFLSKIFHQHQLPDSRPPQSFLNGTVLNRNVFNNQSIANFPSSIYGRVFAGLFSCELFGKEVVQHVTKRVVCAFSNEEFNHFGVACFHGDFKRRSLAIGGIGIFEHIVENICQDGNFATVNSAM